MSEMSDLSRRERQIMEIIYSRGEATATDVLAGLSDPPTRTAVRTLLKILEDKGHLKHRKSGREFVFKPTRSRGSAGISAFEKVLRTFFNGSLETAVAAHLSGPNSTLSNEELQRLTTLINKVKRKEAAS